MLILQDLRLKLLNDDLIKDKEILLTHAQNQSFSRTFSFEKKNKLATDFETQKIILPQSKSTKSFSQVFFSVAMITPIFMMVKNWVFHFFRLFYNQFIL